MSASLTTVVTPATNFNLTTVARVKLERDIRVSTNDAYLAMQIASASAAMANYCNRVFARQTYRQIFRGWTTGINDDLWFGTQANPWGIAESIVAVRLFNYPLDSITSIVEDGVTLVEGTDFEASAENGMIYRLDGNGSRQRWFFSLLTIVYVAGWTLPGDGSTWTLPDDVEGQCIRVVGDQLLFRNRDNTIRRVYITGVGYREYYQRPPTDDAGLPSYVKDSLQASGYVIPIVR